MDWIIIRTSTSFLSGARERVLLMTRTRIARFTPYLQAIGLNDVPYGLHLEDSGKDIENYFTKRLCFEFDRRNNIVVDDFYNNPDEVRDFAFSLPFEVMGNYPRKNRELHQ